MSIEPVRPSSHLILCHPLLLPPSVFPSIRVFSNESFLRIRWPKYWSFSFSISPFNEYSGLIFRMDWLDLLAVQGTLKSLFQHHGSKASILLRSAFFRVQLSHPYTTTGKTIALTGWIFVGKVMPLLFNMLSMFVITFLPRSKFLLISWLQSPSAVILTPELKSSSSRWPSKKNAHLVCTCPFCCLLSQSWASVSEGLSFDRSDRDPLGPCQARWLAPSSAHLRLVPQHLRFLLTSFPEPRSPLSPLFPGLSAPPASHILPVQLAPQEVCVQTQTIFIYLLYQTPAQDWLWSGSQAEHSWSQTPTLHPGPLQMCPQQPLGAGGWSQGSCPFCL